MAAGFFNAFTDPSLGRAVAAGTRPVRRVYPEVVAAMQEVGIDLGDAKPRALTPEMAARADLLVTMGCGEDCPIVPGLRRLDWVIADPRGQSMERIRQIRDEIREHIRKLIGAEGLAPSGARFSESG